MLNCLVPWRIHRQNFLLKAQSGIKFLSIWTISRGENWHKVWIRPCWRFPQHKLFSRSRPHNVFTSFCISRLVSRSLLCSYRRLKYKCVHLNNIWRSRITFFLKQLLDSPCGSKFILILLNLAPPSLSLRFSTPVRHSFNTPAYRGQSWWANMTERVLSLYVCLSRSLPFCRGSRVPCRGRGCHVKGNIFFFQFFFLKR